MNEKLVTSLAILKANWDMGYDYVENFVPFIAECLRLSPHTEVSLPTLQSIVTSEFGLTVPQGALLTILKRAVKRGYALRRDEIYVRNEKALAALNLGKIRSNSLRKQEALIAKFIKFSKDQYQTILSKEEAESTLYSYVENHSMPILRVVVEGEATPVSSVQKRKAEFLIRVFISELCKRDPEGFEFLETIVKGSMLASTLYFPEIEGVKKRFDRVEIYFDTSFLLQALGFGNPSMQIYCKEVLDLLYELNGRPRCFEHTLNELRGILQYAVRIISERKYKSTNNSVVWYFIESKHSISDIELIIARLEESLNSLRIQIKSKPPYQELLGIDEAKLATYMLKEVKYRTDEQLQHDLESLAAIFRLRHGEYPIDVERCQALFVTTNSSLVRASSLFFREEDIHASSSVPICTSSDAFTTVLWLKKPTRAPDLPTKRIVADCYAALNPSDFMWKTYLGEIDNLFQKGKVSDNDYHLLRFSLEARSLLVDTTMGIPDAIVEGTIVEILEKAKVKIRSEAEAAYDGERKRRQDAEERATNAETQAIIQHQAQLDHIRLLSVKWSSYIGKLALIFVIIIQACMIYITLPKPFPHLPDKWRGYFTPPLLILAAILSIANLTFGISLRPYIKELEVRLSHSLERVLLKIFTPKRATEHTK